MTTEVYSYQPVGSDVAADTLGLAPSAPPITVRACGTETNLPLVAQPVADPGEPADAAGPVVAVEAAEIDRVDESMPLRSFGVSLVVAGAATVITIALLLLA